MVRGKQSFYAPPFLREAPADWARMKQKQRNKQRQKLWQRGKSIQGRTRILRRSCSSCPLKLESVLTKRILNINWRVESKGSLSFCDSVQQTNVTSKIMNPTYDSEVDMLDKKPTIEGSGTNC